MVRRTTLDFDFSTETITITTGTTLTISGTGALILPSGTTGERPGTPAAGWIRNNSSLSVLEFYNSTSAAWQTFANAETNGLANLSTNGIVVRTGAGTYTGRSLAVGSTKISLSNADGTAGNPTLDAVEANFTLNNIGGTLGVTKGGTGLTATPTNGQLLIGNGTNYTLAALTQGTGMTITNGAGTVTVTNAGVTSLAGTANQVSASAATGAVTLSLPTTLIAPGSVQITTNLFQTQSTAVSAAGATQGTATALTSRYNIVTTVAASTGVILQTPTSPFGQEVYVANRGANALNIYPNTGAAIGSGATNAAVVLPIGQEVTFVAISATQWHVTEPILVAGTNVTLTPGPGTLTITAAGGSGSPGGANTNVQYNNAGAFGGSSAFNFIAGANPRVDILGTTATNQLRVGGSADPSTATAYIETNTSGAEGMRCYFNSGSPASSGWIVYGYAGSQPIIRLIDADDDPSYIRFDTIGGGTYTTPTIRNRFGGRGADAASTTGFEWQVNEATIALLDSTFVTVPTLLNTLTGVALTATTGAAATTTSVGNNVTLRGGAGGSTSGAGGAVTVTGGIPTAGAGGAVTISGAAGVGTNQNGGNVTITAGSATGTGTTGIVDMSATISAVDLPQGTTAQRPTANTTNQGYFRYNTDEDIWEGIVGYPAGSFGTYAALPFSNVYRKRRYWTDDFVTGSSAATGTALYGELNWSMTAGAGTNSNSIQSGATDHLGILRIGSGAAASGNRAAIHMGTSATVLPLIANQIEYFAWLVRFPTITTCNLKFGLGTDIGAATTGQLGTNGVFFTFDPAVNAALQFITRAGSTSAAAVNTVAIAANTWYLCEAFYDGTQWTPSVNGTNYTAQTTNIPAAIAINMGAQAQTLTTATRQIDIDYFAMITRELGQRY